MNRRDFFKMVGTLLAAGAIPKNVPQIEQEIEQDDGGYLVPQEFIEMVKERKNRSYSYKVRADELERIMRKDWPFQSRW